MKTIGRLMMFAAMAAVIALLCGCGAFTAGGVYIFGDGYIDPTDPENNDGSHYHIVDFTATRSGYIEVSMVSDEVDSYVLVYQGTNESNLIGYDDDSGPGYDAFLSVPITQGITYRVKFTTAGADDFGYYEWQIDQVTVRSAAAGAEPGDKPAKSLDEVSGLKAAK